jgi:hypothetical protein
MDIISLTTIPGRIEHIKPCIDSLLRQNMLIYLWIGKEYNRLKGIIDSLPKFLKHDRIRIRRVEDEGSITKLYPALSLYDVDRIITADDDMIYPDGWAEGLLKASEVHPNKAICYRGRKFRYDKGRKLPYRRSILVRGKNRGVVDIATGVHGVLYRRSFFGDDFFDYRNYDYSRYVDDVWISGYLQSKGIQRLCILGADIRTVQLTDRKPLHRVDSLTKINWKKGAKIDYNDKMINQFEW